MNILKNSVAVLCAGFLLFSLNIFNEPKFIDFPAEIMANAATQTHDISEGDVVINDSDEHIITGTTTQYKVIVESGNPTITIENLNITLGGDNQCPFEIKGNCHLILSGENTLICTNQARGRSGLWIRNGSLTISGDGSLYAEGSGSWAGICVWTAEGNTALTINSGNITARATGSYGAGIGGSQGDSGSITINGGTIEAYGGQYGAGIGGGAGGTNQKITINGGDITAVKGSSAPNDIGAGGSYFNIPGQPSGEIDINGGTVNGIIYDLSYTVIIPQNVQLEQNVNINVSNTSGVAETVNISVNDSQRNGDNFCLKSGDETLNYHIKKDNTNIQNGEYVMSENITANTEKTATLYFTAPVSPVYPGNYSGTLTFTVSVE